MSSAEQAVTAAPLPGRPPDPRRLGIAAVIVDSALAAAFGLFVAMNAPSPPLDVIPRAPVLAAILMTPALVGAIGALTRSPVVLLAAGVACFMKSLIAFSGISLVFLLPAVLYVRAASSGGESVSPGLSAGRVLFFIALAAPIVTVVVLTAGVFVLPLLMVAALAPALRRRGRRWRPPMSRRSIVLGVAIVAIWFGTLSGISMWTETVCWTGRQTADGIAYERVPETNSFTFGRNDVGGGCDSGIPTPEGVARVAVLSLLVIGLSLVAARSSRPADPPRGSAVEGPGEPSAPGPAPTLPDPERG
jgi:hypothetical protein